MKKYRCDRCDGGCPCVIEWGDYPAPIRCPIDGNRVDWQEVENPESKLPKLTVEALKERGIEWPGWAKYVAVWSDGAAIMYENKPKLTDYGWWPAVGRWSSIHDVKWDASEWKISLIERPSVEKKDQKLPEWCKVGRFVYGILEKKYGKIITFHHGVTVIFFGDQHPTTHLPQYFEEAEIKPWNFETGPLQVKVVSMRDPSLEFVLSLCPDGYYKVGAFSSGREHFKEVLRKYIQIDGSPCGIATSPTSR